jgi:hypothetical protein
MPSYRCCLHFTRSYDSSAISRLLHSFIKFQVFFSMTACGLVYVYWLVDELVACILWIILMFGLPWRMRQQAPPKCQKLYTSLHSDIPQKVWIFICTTVRTAVLLKIQDFGYVMSLDELFLMFWRIVVPASASIWQAKTK